MHIKTDKQTLVFLLSSIGLIVFPHIGHLPASIFAFFAVLWSWRFLGVWKPELLPNKLLLFLLMIAGIALLYSQHHGIFGRDAGTQLFIVALGLKLMEIKTQRDLFLVAYLAFIVAASQFLFEQSLLMGAYCLLVACLLLATLVLINSRNVLPWAAVKTAGVILLQALPIAIALFVLFPRFEAPRWAMFNDSSRARSGLSDSMEPGSISELGLSDELVFRVQFNGDMPPPSQRYWRGPVLAYTDGKRWTQTETRAPFFLDKPKFTGPAYQYTLLMEPQNKTWVFALDLPSEIPSPLKQTMDYRLLTTNNPDKRSEYPLISYPNYNTGRIRHFESNEALQLPAMRSEKITALVKQLHGFEAPPAQFINQVLNHFRQEDFHYTLTPPLLDEGQPLETFLFKTRYGFCSHYAAAFVYMMRIANIPARVVTGYQGGEFNKLGNFLEVRQADAHAWAEVWLENQGWVRVDPTAAIAPERIEKNINIEALAPESAISFISGDGGLANNWFRQAHQLWSNIDYNWQRWVINYNNKNQASFLAAWGINNLWGMMQWLLGIVAISTAVITLWVLRPQTQNYDKVLRLYQRFCAKLAKRGLVKNQAEGETDFAGRAKLQLPALGQEIDAITATVVRLRYGKQSNPNDIKQLERWVKLFKV